MPRESRRSPAILERAGRDRFQRQRLAPAVSHAREKTRTGEPPTSAAPRQVNARGSQPVGTQRPITRGSRRR